MTSENVDVEQEITKVVVRQFLEHEESTSRSPLVRDFRDPDALTSLVSKAVLKSNNNLDFFPTALAFHFCQIPRYEQLAKDAVEIIASILQDLFLKEIDKTDFTVAEIEAHATQLRGKPEPGAIRLGLYLAGEFGWLAGWGGNLEKFEITNLRISERVVMLKNFDRIWDEQIRQRIPSLTGPWLPNQTKKSKKKKRSNWEKIRPLGTGGQSEVFLARSPKRVAERASSLGKIQEQSVSIGEDGAAEFAVAAFNYARPDLSHELGALKVFKARAQGAKAKKQVVSRLKNEIAVLSQNRPSLIKLLDSNEKERWIVTEYYPKGTLENDPLRFKGRARSTLVAFRSLVSTVADLHKDGIIHRDIKPANVFIGSDENLILGDFGIVFAPNNQERATHTGERVGPRDYMPPWAEIGRLEDVDAKFDVYMLGKLLWSMVTGRPKLVREYYTRDENNPTVLFRDDPDMYAINQVLGHCVVENPKECLSSARDLLLVVNTLLALIERGGQLLNDGVPRPCHVCGRGFYRPEQGGGVKPEPTVGLQLSRVAPNLNQHVGVIWLQPLVCDICGHAEFFRPKN
jgi:serine/threonine protein kinase